MRTIFLGCILAFAFCAHAADRSDCKSRDSSSEQSWNPSSAGITPRLRHFYGVGQQLEAAQAANDVENMEKVAKEYLSVANEFQCNWNYGNAIHDANAALGLAALANHDERQAAKYLLEAGKSPGSPQLDTFGPTMILADKLVTAGDRDTVIGYLEGVRRFWRMDDGEIDKWIALLKAGKHPDFRMQLQ